MKDSDYLAESIYGDNWWIEGKWAWFVWGLNNLLFRVDLRSKKGECQARILGPSLSKYKSHSRCMKYGDDIYCMPGYGKSICIYNLKNSDQQEIVINNPDNIPIIASSFWEFENRILVALSGLGQIVEINPEKRKIEEIYSICKGWNITKSIMVDGKIYNLLRDLNVVSILDLYSEKIESFHLPDIGKKFFTLCFDGEKFWLSGSCKEIYVWNKETNMIDILSDFSKKFGIYDFSEGSVGQVDCEIKGYEGMLFIDSIVLGDNIWFIPYQANKIIYVNKDTYQFNEFEIQEEREEKDSIPKSIGFKYIVEYVNNDRFIGLFSIKNRCMVEIDTLELKYKYKQYEYAIDDWCYREYVLSCDNVLDEGYIWDRMVLGKKTKIENDHMYNGCIGKVGNSIYREMVSKS